MMKMLGLFYPLEISVLGAFEEMRMGVLAGESY